MTQTNRATPQFSLIALYKQQWAVSQCDKLATIVSRVLTTLNSSRGKYPTIILEIGLPEFPDNSVG